MATLTRAQLYSYAQQAGFSGTGADVVVAIALAESGGDTQHKNVNGASVTKIGSTTTNVPAGTLDRGVLQINDWWNNGQAGHGPMVTDACAYDPVCSFKWAYGVSHGGVNGASSFFPYWVTVQNGAYQKYMTPGGSTKTGTSGGASTGNSTSTGTSTTPTPASPTAGAAGSKTPTGTGTGVPPGIKPVVPGLSSSGNGAYTLSGGSGTNTPISSMNTGPTPTGTSHGAIILILVLLILVGGVILIINHKKPAGEQDKDDTME